MSDPIYLDYNATTPVASEVLEAMLPWLREHFGNPSSTHPFGRRAAKAVATARQQVADLVGAQAHEIVFTGCATEANNLALLGVAASAGSTRQHLLVSAVEHPAVLAPAMWLREQGWQVSVVPVDRYGRVVPERLAEALRPNTALISVMHANNEIGTLQPIDQITSLARERGIPVHTDAAQSAGKVPLDVEGLGVDLLTLAGHKFYAPKGVGALYVRTGTLLRGVLHGADQERGLRPGTENVAAIVALGAAAALARSSLSTVAAHMRVLRDQLHARLTAAIPGLVLNGHPEHRLPNTLHLSFPGVSGRTLLNEAATIVAASVGSACHSEQETVSGVLAAIGADSGRAAGAVRLSVGRMTTTEEIEHASSGLIATWQQLRPSRRTCQRSAPPPGNREDIA